MHLVNKYNTKTNIETTYLVDQPLPVNLSQDPPLVIIPAKKTLNKYNSNVTENSIQITITKKEYSLPPFEMCKPNV